MTRHPFKVGDVVAYMSTTTDTLVPGIVTDCPEKHRENRRICDAVWAFWKPLGIDEWHDRPGHMQPEFVEAHPDPEPILASFTAWRLTGEQP